jgi:hypothetical protein
VEHKRGRIRRVKYRKTALAILAALSTSLALAEDFKTTNGKEYKNVTVIKKEPDGITVTDHKSVLVKLYFTELPKKVQERFHYDATESDEYSRKQNEALEQLNKGALQEERLGQMRRISGKIISKSNNALLVECSGEGSSGRSDAATGRVVLRDHPNFAALAEGDRVAVNGVVIPATQWGDGDNPYLHAYRVPIEAQSAVRPQSAVRRKAGAPNQTPTPPTKSP